MAAWYSTALEAQASSGLSVAQYAAKIGVSVPTLYQWRRRLGPMRSDGRTAKLIEVTAARPTSSANESLLLRIGDGGRSVVVPRGFDANDLRRLVEVLESC